MSFIHTIPNFMYRGIPKIMIPKQEEDFRNPLNALAILNKYLPLVLTKHSYNRKKIDYLHKYTIGQQDILNKQRLYKKDKKNNNKISENHAFRQTNFKVAFITSDKRDYAHKSESSCMDMVYLDRYFTDVDFFAKDKNVKEWIYQTGVGCTYQCHRTDIIQSSGDGRFRYLSKEDGFDIEREAPFEFDDLDPRDNFVVYSSIRGNKPLFCVSLVQVDKTIEGMSSFMGMDYKIYIETKYDRYVAECNKSFQGFKNLKFETQKTFHSIPMIEHSINNSRLGIVELNRDLLNCVNTLVSNVLDMVVDGANIIMVFKNTDINQQTINEMVTKGAVVLHDKPDNKNNSEAKLDVITVKIDFDGLNSFYEQRLTQAYDIAGVPLASGQVTSGGDTGQARLLGGGWENARTIARNDIMTLLKSDYAVLKLALSICKDIPGCPVKNISASEIDIKYHVNQSDNLLAKAEAISLLYKVNMPKEEILKTTGLVSDVCVASQKWEKEDTIMQEYKLQLARPQENDQTLDDIRKKHEGNSSKE